MHLGGWIFIIGMTCYFGQKLHDEVRHSVKTISQKIVRDFTRSEKYNIPVRIMILHKKNIIINGP